MIYCVGDSHSAVFSGEEVMQPIYPLKASNKCPYFKSFRIGPATAYNLINKKNVIEQIIAEIDFNTDNYIMFCFGEVDVRAHLSKKIIIENLPEAIVIEDCVNRYIDTILYFKKYNIPIIIWGVIASWHESKPYIGPSFGSNKERNLITQKFNKMLLEKSSLIDVAYLDIFEYMLDENMETRYDLLDDWEGSHIHLSQKCMDLIINKFKLKGLIKD